MMDSLFAPFTLCVSPVVFSCLTPARRVGLIPNQPSSKTYAPCTTNLFIDVFSSFVCSYALTTCQKPVWSPAVSLIIPRNTIFSAPVRSLNGHHGDRSVGGLEGSELLSPLTRSPIPSRHRPDSDLSRYYSLPEGLRLLGSLEIKNDKLEKGSSLLFFFWGGGCLVKEGERGEKRRMMRCCW